MVSTGKTSYRAFLSYSHRDKKWGKWLHDALENYRVPKPLIGKPTPVGPVPRTLRPIFRDRWDLSAGHSLQGKIEAALAASEFLVVICSPASAQSAYVNEEVRRFKMTGGEERILALIVDGEPGDPEQECFPPALRCRVDHDGVITDDPEEPVAADARPNADGRDLAKLKIIGGLIGVELDELRQREEVARRARQNFRNGIIGVLLLLLVAATGSAVYAYQQLREKVELLDRTIEITYGIVREAVDLSKKMGVPVSASLPLLRRAETALNGILSDSGDTPLLRYRSAQMDIAFANSFGALGRNREQQDRLLRARKSLSELLASDPDNAKWGWALTRTHCGMARPLVLEGLVKQALAELEHCRRDRQRLVEKHPDNNDWRIGLANVESRLSLSRSFLSGKNFSAYDEHTEQIKRARKLLEQDPGNVQVQLSLAWNHESRGIIKSAQGQHREALEEHRKSNQIIAEAAKADPEKKDVQSALAGSFKQIGSAHAALRETDAALRNLRSALKIQNALVSKDPENVVGLEGLADIFQRIAMAQISAGQSEQALSNLKKASELLAGLLKDNARNTGWIAILHENQMTIADVARKRGDTSEALKSLDSASELLGEMKIDLTNATILNAQAMSHEKLGYQYSQIKAYEKSVANYVAAQKFRRRLVQSAPDDTGHRHALAKLLSSTAFSLWYMQQRPQAFEAQREAIAILNELVGAAPSDVQWLADLSSYNLSLGDWLKETNAFDEALEKLALSIAFREKLIAAEPQNTNWKKQLAWSHYLVGEVRDRQKRYETALASYRTAITIGEQQADLHKDDDDWRINLYFFYRQLAVVQSKVQRNDLALQASRTSLTHAQAYAGANPDDEQSWRKVNLAHHAIGARLQQMKRYKDAEASFRARLDIAERRLALVGQDAERLYQVALARGGLAENLVKQKDPARAIPVLETTRAEVDRGSKLQPDNHDWLDMKLYVNDALLASHRQRDDAEQVLEVRKQRLAILKKFLAVKQDDEAWQSRALDNLASLCSRFRNQRQSALALPCYELAQKHVAELSGRNPETKKWNSMASKINGPYGEYLFELQRYDEAGKRFAAVKSNIEALMRGSEGKFHLLFILVLAEQNIGNVHQKLRRPEAALAAYRRAISHDFTDASPAIANRSFKFRQWRMRYEIGKIEQRRDALGEAARSLTAARTRAEALLSSEPDDLRAKEALARTLVRLAMVYRAQDKHHEAVELLSRSYGLARQLPAGIEYTDTQRLYSHNVLYGRAQEHHAIGNLPAALRDISLALSYYPRWQYALQLRAKIHASRGDLDAALADLNEALFLAPDYKFARRKRADLLARMQRWDDAIRDYTKLIDAKYRLHQTYNGRAWAYYKLGRFGEGLADVQKSLEIDPNNAYALDTRGHLYEALHRYEEAIADLTRVLELNPEIQGTRETMVRVRNKIDQAGQNRSSPPQ